MQFIVVQTADLYQIVFTVCTHVPKHLKFAQINNKYQSDVNEKILVQRSELIVSKKKKKFEHWAEAIEKNCNVLVMNQSTFCFVCLSSIYLWALL